MSSRKTYVKFNGETINHLRASCAIATKRGYHSTAGRAKLAYYNALTVPELRKIAAEKNIPGRSKMVKQQLIDWITND